MAHRADLLHQRQGVPKVVVFDHLAASEAYNEAPWHADPLAGA
jgi:hypothetical protein